MAVGCFNAPLTLAMHAPAVDMVNIGLYPRLCSIIAIDNFSTKVINVIQ